jgi:hypothetical protein
VIAEAAGLALLAAMSPTALLVAGIYLVSARPRQTGLFYLAGAVLMSAVMGAVVLLALRGANLNHPHQHAPRDGLRLGLGIVLLAAGIALAVHKARPPDPAKAGRGFVTRMVANPAPLSALVVGIVVFAPGVSFIAALQVIATARADLELTLVAVSIVVSINVLLVWLPLVLYLVAPGFTARHLTVFNDWLRAHGSALLVWVLVVVGAIMVFDGIYGFAVGRG